MTIRRKFPLVVAGLALIIPSTGRMKSGQNRGPCLLGTPGNEHTVVRIFYNPSPSDYFHVPLDFRVLGMGDARLNTSPVLLEGQTAYITDGEMQKLLDGLSQSDLTWTISEKVEALGSYHHLLIGNEVRVVSPKGTAVATLDAKDLCSTLQPLDLELSTARALWEFQLLRVQDGCEVPGFNYQTYPDHW